MRRSSVRFGVFLVTLLAAGLFGQLGMAATRVGPSSLYPNPTLTPGATNPAITQETVSTTICNPKWSTRSIRPTVQYTNQLKQKQIRQYGYLDTNPAHYEEDHLISLELGGHPTDPRNLWPESYLTTIRGAVMGAKQKDRVENTLHRRVCQGTMSLHDAQQRIVADWYQEYLKEK